MAQLFWCHFPLPIKSNVKKRPAVVISGGDYNSAKPDIILMPITSQLRATAALGELWIGDWQGAGLLKPSAVKPVIATLEQSLIIRVQGQLLNADSVALREVISLILG